MKHQVTALRLHPGKVSIAGVEFNMTLPPGCVGIMFCFESKKSARAYWGNDVDLLRVEEKPDNQSLERTCKRSA